MNKVLLEQQVAPLGQSEEPGEFVFNTANIAQFCIQQLLDGDGEDFSNLLASRPKIQDMFKEMQEMVGDFLEAHLDEFGENWKQKTAPKLAQVKAGTQNYINKLGERVRKTQEAGLREARLHMLEKETENLKEERQSLGQKIQALANLQETLSACDMEQLWSELAKQQQRVRQEKEQRIREEERERQLSANLQGLHSEAQALEEKIRDTGGNIRQKTASLLEKKRESWEKRKEKLKKLELREQRYLKCREASAKIYGDAEKHLSEDDRVAGCLEAWQVFPEEQRPRLEAVREGLNQKMRKFAQFNLIGDGLRPAMQQRGSQDMDP